MAPIMPATPAKKANVKTASAPSRSVYELLNTIEREPMNSPKERAAIRTLQHRKLTPLEAEHILRRSNRPEIRRLAEKALSREMEGKH